MNAKITVRLVKEKNCFGPGIEELLECIKTCGSIKHAAAQMGLSYTKALRILGTAEQELGFALLDRCPGGSNGGRAVLTKQGADFLELYHQYNEQVQQFAKDLFPHCFSQYIGK